MRFGIYLLAVAALVVCFASPASARPECSHDLCTKNITATEKVKRWVVPGKAGKEWLLYLNIYTGQNRLIYERLPGECDASYSSAYASAVLHACSPRSALDYVSFAGSRRLRVEYRYVHR